VPSLPPADHYQLLWSSGSLGCFLVVRHRPPTYSVQVSNDEQTVLTEPCRDVDHAEKIAEALWGLLIETRP
jgi:hypothetical protein